VGTDTTPIPKGGCNSTITTTDKTKVSTDTITIPERGATTPLLLLLIIIKRRPLLEIDSESERSAQK